MWCDLSIVFATFVEKKWLDLARGAEEGRRRQNKVLATQKEECADDGMIDDGGDGDLARGLVRVVGRRMWWLKKKKQQQQKKKKNADADAADDDDYDCDIMIDGDCDADEDGDLARGGCEGGVKKKVVIKKEYWWWWWWC